MNDESPQEYLKKTKKIVSLLNPTHYTEEMWKVALKMNLDEVEELEKAASELNFIAQYVRRRSSA